MFAVTSCCVVVGKLLDCSININGTRNRHNAELEHTGLLLRKVACSRCDVSSKMFQADVTTNRTERRGRVVGAPAF
jgi:hypothetical protein